MGDRRIARSDRPVPTKLFVGNIGDNCRRSDLLSIFEEHGEVVECDIVKNFAFVHYNTKSEATRAIDALNEADFFGEALCVKLSTSGVRQKPGMGENEGCYKCGNKNHWSKNCTRADGAASSSKSTKLFIGNVGEDCSKEVVLNSFQEFGEIVECDVIKNYAFVHFRLESEAKDAVDARNNTYLNGSHITVQLSTSNVRQKPGMGESDGCYKCGGTGHWSKTCPHEHRGFGSGGRDSGRGGYSEGRGGRAGGRSDGRGGRAGGRSDGRGGLDRGGARGREGGGFGPMRGPELPPPRPAPAAYEDYLPRPSRISEAYLREALKDPIMRDRLDRYYLDRFPPTLSATSGLDHIDPFARARRPLPQLPLDNIYDRLPEDPYERPPPDYYSRPSNGGSRPAPY